MELTEKDRKRVMAVGLAAGVSAAVSFLHLAIEANVNDLEGALNRLDEYAESIATDRGATEDQVRQGRKLAYGFAFRLLNDELKKSGQKRRRKREAAH